MRSVHANAGYRAELQKVFTAALQRYKKIERPWTRQERAGEWTVCLRRELFRSDLVLYPRRFYPHCNFRSLFKDLYDVDLWVDVGQLRNSDPTDQLGIVVRQLLKKPLEEFREGERIKELAGLLLEADGLIGEMSQLNSQLDLLCFQTKGL